MGFRQHPWPHTPCPHIAHGGEDRRPPVPQGQAPISLRAWEPGCIRHLPVVDETERDRVPRVAGWRRPALSQDHLEVAFLLTEPHFDLDVITGRHTVILRYRGVPNKQLHFGDKIASAMEVLDDGVDPVRATPQDTCKVCFCDPTASLCSPNTNSKEVWK